MLLDMGSIKPRLVKPYGLGIEEEKKHHFIFYYDNKGFTVVANVKYGKRGNDYYGEDGEG